jgi:ABC-type multidrug transport system ATPase subunit
MGQELLRVEDLAKRYGRRTVFGGVSFCLVESGITGVFGENGSGKTTLLKCLLGIEAHQRGSVWTVERPGYCPQENYLNPRYTVEEHLGFAASIYGTVGPLEEGYPASLLDRFRLRPCLKQRISTLSGGTYQKVKFVTSILDRPRLVLLDEPYDGFDWRMYEAFWEVLAQLRAAGAAVLLVTHFAFDRARFDALLSLEGGTLVGAS